ncbi:thioredoxin family protein [Halovenus salina]|uniref:Thioredoxin family protein n=1 Tax=Halovenus salina TaxID=1510225 RepID=A0ABD5W774_9EURY|nr:thioredoxin family protein [Halovenus salina]
MNETDHSDRPVTLQTEDDLEALLADTDLALVEFYTDGCGICQSMEPVLTNVARETAATVATINPRDDPPLVERFQVQSVPLFVLFADGDPVDRRADGFIGADDLLAWVEESA